jgi:pimeloyl-ACP methyl ester carboxylesterase
MKMLICLHGNPLQGQEFDLLLPALKEKGFHPIVHRRPLKGAKLESLLQSINATAKVSGGGPFSFLAYSWGAFLALAYLSRFPENVKSLVLVNPFLIDPLEKESKKKNFLDQVPLMRSMVMRFKKRSRTIAYIRETFDPLEPSEQLKQSLHSFLTQAHVWKGAHLYKKLMKQPLLSENFSGIQIPVKVLFGEQDQLAPSQEQLEVLRCLPNVQFKFIKAAGHSLPWTHTHHILEEVEALANEKN